MGEGGGRWMREAGGGEASSVVQPADPPPLLAKFPTRGPEKWYLFGRTAARPVPAWRPPLALPPSHPGSRRPHLAPCGSLPPSRQLPVSYLLIYIRSS